MSNEFLSRFKHRDIMSNEFLSRFKHRDIMSNEFLSRFKHHDNVQFNDKHLRQDSLFKTKPQDLLSRLFSRSMIIL